MRTHDEKMFRAVEDRAQWFDVVMGRPNASDEYGIEVEETRLPLHTKVRKAPLWISAAPSCRSIRDVF